LFREPTVWDRYRAWFIAGISICILQALLITGLLANLVKRRRAEHSLTRAEVEARRRREQINLLSRVSLLGEMTASLAHELNQPLSAIITNANAGKRLIDRGKEDPELLREILVDVVADGHRAHEIIQDVRNTVKKGDAIRRRINLNELVTNVAHVVRPDAVACSCELETSLEKDLPLIEGDPVQIQQVLVNLVSNAFDAMRQTPLSRRKVEISTAGSGDGQVRLSVRDHGTGIHTTVHERLFDQFFTTKEQGLGMGLAIVRSIVEAHGGQIDAENVADGGARFHFTLPVMKPAAEDLP
jgi:C4-dicarboxylate-specific signal transduction histidine kinase